MIGLEPPDPLGGHIIRRLQWEAGNLRGGAGGGGGGLSLFGCLSASLSPPCSGGGVNLTNYEDNSACAGGGGGGAVLLVSGQVLTLGGQILANGGDGGSGAVSAQFNQTRASPGGGGSGGAVKMQAKTLNIVPVPARININGGAGGQTDMCDFAAVCNSKGGNGGYGLVRLEDTSGTLTRPLLSPFITPYDPNHVNPVTGLVESEQLLSVGPWPTPRFRPDSYTSSVSCWMQPLGNFFQLDFIADDLSNPDPNLHTFGWNMEVLYNSGSGQHSYKYRGPDSSAGYPFPSGDFESNIGNKLNHGAPAGTGSYFAVRFQGAKALGSVAGNPCDVTLSGIGNQIAPGSLTPWVRQPSDLNNFSPRPNMIRFCVVFDTSLVTPASIPLFIKGVTNLKISVQPD